MAATPEGAVKKMVKDFLGLHQGVVGPIYQFMPVQGGFGAATLDFMCCHNGRFFAIETKAPGKSPTDRQTGIIAHMVSAGAKVFVISNDEGIMELRAWLNGLIE